MAAKREKRLSEEAIEKKLMSFNNTQDSVQGMSLWIMHNKAHHQKIVDTWLNVLKKCKTKHKLTLLYLCNDVVQHAKKKKALYYLENFKDNLREAIQVIREFDSIKPNVGRIFKIWEERRTYDAKFIKELRGILDSEPAGSGSLTSSANATPLSPIATPLSPITPAQVSPAPAYKPSVKADSDTEDKHAASLPGDFKPSKFVELISALKKQEGDVAMKTKLLTSLRIDATNIEAVKQLKDRSHGNEFCKQFEESCNKIEDYVNMLEKEIQQRKLVLSICDDAESFYNEQFSEARIVANAYKNFGARISNMKKRVDDMKKIIPATPSPVPSPSADAPSPGGTPPLQDMDDNDMVDMDLSDDEAAGNSQSGAGSMDMYNPENPSEHEPLDDIEPGKSIDTFQGSNVLESRIATMLPKLAKGNSSLGLHMPPVNVPSAVITENLSTPQKTDPINEKFVATLKPVENVPSDDRASTPVMDEQEEKDTPPPRKQTPPTSKPATKVKTNPIDFLSQLLTKSSSSSSSSNFLHSLSLLTNTVKSQYQKQQGGDSMSVSDPHSSQQPQSTVFSAVPPPNPVTQTSNWSTWKDDTVTAAQSRLPPHPEIITQPVLPMINQELPPQPPPLPPEPATVLAPLPPNQAYPGQAGQPPSLVDFSLPPPTTPQGPMKYIRPPPISAPYNPPLPSSQPFTHSSSLASSSHSNSQQVFPTQATSLLSPQSPAGTPSPGTPGFNPNFPFGHGHAPPRVIGPGVPQSGSGPPPRLPTQGFLHNGPPGQPPGWDQSQQRSIPSDIAPPIPSQPVLSSYAPPPPPPPPETTGQSQWQDNKPIDNRDSRHAFGRGISAMPRSDWNRAGADNYEEADPWKQREVEREPQGGGASYAHPWDQPQNYDEEDELDNENDNSSSLQSNSQTVVPKSILRNNRSSSLREVTLVDNNESNVVENRSSFMPAARNIQPTSILKKPQTQTPIQPMIPVSDVQNEFIAKLKQKSGELNDNHPPPASRTLTSVSMSESLAHPSDGYEPSQGMGDQGEAISTIGVLGSNGRTSSVKSDDMDIDNDGDTNYENEWVSKTEDTDSWQQNKTENASSAWQQEDKYWNDQPDVAEPQVHDYGHGSNASKSEPITPTRYVPSEPFSPGPRGHRPRFGGDFEHFRPQGRGFNPRPPRHFQDHYRGASPAKRPFFSPRQRMPYHRY